VKLGQSVVYVYYCMHIRGMVR